ncbi:hypothetical protein INR49_006010 [Caranx melampygus]|nr:hypothetical protein INR49_006010 [Caranx melampygus]
MERKYEAPNCIQLLDLCTSPLAFVKQQFGQIVYWKEKWRPLENMEGSIDENTQNIVLYVFSWRGLACSQSVSSLAPHSSGCFNGTKQLGPCIYSHR